MLTKHSSLLLAILTSAVPASAATYNVSLTGTLTTQHPGDVQDTKGLTVGSQFVLTASFDASLLQPNGLDLAAGMYGLPIDGAGSFFRIDGPGMAWASTDSLADGLWGNKSPYIYVIGDKVVGLRGYLSPAGSSDRPELDLGGDGSDRFAITAPRGMYGDYYETPGFLGVWDFADSSVIDPPSPGDAVISMAAVSAAPEPGTWGLFAVGFALLGLFTRRRKLLEHAAT